MSHHKRTATSGGVPAPPAWNTGSWSQRVASISTVARLVWAILRRHRRTCILSAGAVLALASQIILLCIAFYLVDLSIALMETWALLARKHLELTLTAAGG